MFTRQTRELVVKSYTRELLNSAHARFLERAKGSTPLHAQELWGEALDQCSKGWLDSPTPLDCTSERLVLNSEQFNPAFRFPVLQNGQGPSMR